MRDPARARVLHGALQPGAILAVTKCAPCRASSRRTAPSTGASQITEFSAEHSTPLSNALPFMMSLAALATSAVRSTMAGTFPGPTPNAGFPEL